MTRPFRNTLTCWPNLRGITPTENSAVFRECQVTQAAADYQDNRLPEIAHDIPKQARAAESGYGSRSGEAPSERMNEETDERTNERDRHTSSSGNVEKLREHE